MSTSTSPHEPPPGAEGRPVSDPTVHGFVAPGFEQVKEEFTRNLTTRGDIGAAFAVCRGNATLVDLWGGSSAPPDRLWTRDTLQLVFSGTKGLVATALLVLVDRGELDLDAPVCSYWPEFAAAGKEHLTVGELVSHRARLPGVDEPLALEDVLDDAAMARRLAAQRPSDDPRAGAVYHALTYGWLCAGLVRSITGATIGELFAQQVARPLDLELWIGLPAAEEPRVSTLVYGPHWGNGPQFDPEALAGDSLLASVWANPALFPPDEVPWNRRDFHAAEIPGANAIGTARSMARLYACLAAGGHLDGVELLSVETVELGRRERSRFVDPLTLEPLTYGAGFQLQTELRRFGAPADAFGHAGAGGSIHAAWPTQGIGLSYAMNELRDDPDGDPRTTALLEALHEALQAEGSA
jgi:CubicO group peptidase (beta-lactamase class C family)